MARIVGDGFDTDEITRAIRASMAESAAMAESVVATRPLPVASAPPASGAPARTGRPPAMAALEPLRRHCKDTILSILSNYISIRRQTKITKCRKPNNS